MIKLEINNQTSFKIQKNKLKRAARIISRYFKIKDKRVSVGVVDKKEMKKLNKKYRKKDKATDVLSFAGEDDYLGEIIICAPMAGKQAEKFNHSFHRELQFLLIHGLLHVLGFEHKSEKGKRQMEKTQKIIMDKL